MIRLRWMMHTTKKGGRRMSKQKQGTMSGIRHGLSLMVDPDPARLRRLANESEAEKILTAAWSQVGQAIRDSCSTATRHGELPSRSS